jgi:hypothetical protein
MLPPTFSDGIATEGENSTNREDAKNAKLENI